MRNRLGLSRNIPKEIKRRVRRRCGYGCVICGSALITYEHFDPPFRDAGTHKPEGITLLCGTHQLQSSKGLLSKETISEWNSNPICRRQGYASQMLDFGATRPIILIGSTNFTECGIGIAVNRRWLFQVKPPEPNSMRWRLSATFLSADGTIVCEIQDNELTIPAVGFEIEQIGQTVTVRNEADVILDFSIQPPNLIVINQYKITTPTGTIFVGSRMHKNPLTGNMDKHSVFEFRHNNGAVQTFVNCAFKSPSGINLMLENGGMTFSSI
jgi:hypothetical protein